ncbi:MAG TPA: hypothetical protein VFT91_04110, partial [Dehalococcoidia bacterium]|nr:hypothetical protein [Dehalococcoidia bacterium]
AALVREEEQQYIPFIAGAIFSALVVGFPVGLLLAHAAAQGGTLGGRWPALAQVHGHIQLAGWLGLFLMGMGYRLVPRFSGVKVRPAGLVPLTFGLMAAGLSLRAVSQPWAEEAPLAGLWVGAAALEAAAALLFATVILRCLATGRHDQYGYTPFFAAGAAWLAVAALLTLAFVADAVVHGVTTIDPPRSWAVAFVMLYGFAASFVFAVSLRTFPVFFERKPAPRVATVAAWALAQGGTAAYASALVWQSYDRAADVRLLLSAAFLSVGVALAGLVVLLRIFEGTPHRLRESARRSMRFVRSAYAWLLIGAGMQVFFAARALADERLPSYYETDAVRHFLAVGFLTIMIIGMAFMVLPPLAMRRLRGRTARLVAPAVLLLLHGAAAARGAGSLLANETKLESGFWTMSAAGVLAVLAMAVFAVYLLWSPRTAVIPVAARAD